MGDGLFEKMGAQPKNQSAWHPIFCEDFGQGGGLFTNRCVLTDPSSVPVRRYYGGKLGALCLPSLNTEISVRNTLIRRYGLSEFSTTTYPTPPLRAFSFELLDGTVQVLIDTGTSGSLVVTSVDASSGGTAVYHGTFPGGGSNAYLGLTFQIAGFTGANNNGTFIVSASSTTQLTLSNLIASAETHASTAISYGAVYYDQQNGSKTLLFSKQPGAGQTCFVAVAGIVYCGDGVDTWIYNPSSSANSANGNGVWGWGIPTPTVQPTLTITPSGSASVAWAANTIISTMGLVYDSASGTIQQLQSVNATGTNITQFGTSGNGQPAWDQTPGGTTSDGSITWTNKGPIVLWTANSPYTNSSLIGTAAAPAFIYDPGTKAVYLMWTDNFKSGNSGPNPPKFIPGNGALTKDGSIGWRYLGGVSNTLPGLPSVWAPLTSYPRYGSPTGLDAPFLTSEPVTLINGLPANQTVYMQISSGGTSGAGGTPPPFSAVAGEQTSPDGDLIWLSLGSATWVPTTAVSGWTASGVAFSAVKDAQGNFQVCTTTGVTATKVPGSSYSITSVDNAVGGNTVYHYSSTTAMPAGNSQNPVYVTFSGFAQSTNNGIFKIISSTATSVTVSNSAGVSDTTGTGIYNQWAGNYGGITTDGTAVWTCVGSSVAWAVSTKWYLPSAGFAPPSSSQPYGGASIIDSNTNVEFVINSGKTGGSAPTWSAIGSYTNDSGTSYSLTDVQVDTPSVGFTTYVGTGLSGLAGHQLVVSGFTNATNNVLITPLSSTATTLVIATDHQVNEAAATATAKGGLIWYNLEAFSSNSLVWQFGYSYAYSYKSRSLVDYYSTPDPTTGKLPIPPGLTTPLPYPTGSLTGDISSASPVYSIVGSDNGAVNTVGGPYSPDPAVDTIVIWRSADSASGSGQMFELTEIPNIPSLASVKPWAFRDYLPDTPTSLYPGLDVLSAAPVDGVNDPVPGSARPMAYSFQRIWCAVGHNVVFSEGPDSLGGNPNSQFAASDEFPFLGTVIRAVKTTSGLLVLTTSSVEIIAGGPQTASFYSVTLAPNIGLSGYNALDVFAGEIYFISTDHQLRVVAPTLSVTSLATPISDQLMTFNPVTAYIAFHEQPNDSAIYFGTGLTTYNSNTGWFRCNPRQVPGGANGPEPVWSSFAAISNGCQMLQSIEISPGIKKLLVGSTSGGQHILMRDTSVFTDDGTAYSSYAVVGSLRLCNRGEIALCYFLESDFALVTTSPTVSFLLNEIAAGGTASFVPFTLAPKEDPPSIYGETGAAQTYNPYRYYFAGTTEVAQAVHMQIKIDFGTTSVADECFNFTILGAVVKNK